MSVHIGFSVAKDCENPYDSYGVVCVGCNCCGRYNPDTKMQCQLELNKRMLQESIDFDQWAADAKIRAIQRRNKKSDIKYFTKKIATIEAEIAKQEANHE